MVIFLRRLFRTVSWWILGEVMRPETLGFYGMTRKKSMGHTRYTPQKMWTKEWGTMTCDSLDFRDWPIFLTQIQCWVKCWEVFADDLVNSHTSLNNYCK